MITLDMTIDDQGEMEYNRSIQKGQIFQKQTFDVLMYEEELEEGMNVRNLITIYPTKVTIKRSGTITMTQQFIVGQITESVYEHPHGNFHMETYTNSITYKPTENNNQGELVISYTVKLNGTNERKHVLKLTYKKEGI